jgi:outer membrane protein assembly factor BamE (lipoprotein component of BamABCDE complex)
MPRRRPPAAALLVSALLAGCSPVVHVQGFVPDEPRLESLRRGIDDRAAITSKLGSPSSITPFDSDTWLYVHRRTERVAFFEEKVLDQQVVVVTFNDSGMLSEIRRYSIKDGRIIDPVTRTTPTRGRELGVVEQLLGNLGRFGGGRDSGN